MRRGPSTFCVLEPSELINILVPWNLQTALKSSYSIKPYTNQTEGVGAASDSFATGANWAFAALYAP